MWKNLRTSLLTHGAELPQRAQSTSSELKLYSILLLLPQLVILIILYACNACCMVWSMVRGKCCLVQSNFPGWYYGGLVRTTAPQLKGIPLIRRLVDQSPAPPLHVEGPWTTNCVNVYEGVNCFWWMVGLLVLKLAAAILKLQFPVYTKKKKYSKNTDNLIISWTVDCILHKLTKVMWAGLHHGLQPVHLLSGM